MAEMSAWQHEQFDALTRSEKSLLQRLNSPFPELVREAQKKLVGILRGEGPEGRIGLIITWLEDKGTERVKTAIAEIRKLQESLLELGDFSTSSVGKAFAWVKAKAKDPTITGHPAFPRFLEKLRTRILREALPDDSRQLRKLFNKLRSPPFSPKLTMKDWKAIAIHLVPAPSDERTLKDNGALDLLMRRMRTSCPTPVPLIDQLSLAASDPNWNPNNATLKRVSELFTSNHTDATESRLLSALTCRAAQKFLEGKFKISHIDALLFLTKQFLVAGLPDGTGDPDFIPLRESFEKFIGDPPLKNLSEDDRTYESTLGCLAVLTGLHMIKSREWLDHTLESAKQAEADPTAEHQKRFLAMVNFVGEPLEKSGIASEFARMICDQRTYFNLSGIVWGELGEVLRRLLRKEGMGS